MGNERDDKNRAFNNFFGFGIPSAEPTKTSNLADLLRGVAFKPTIPPPPEDNPFPNLASLRYLGSPDPFPESPLGRIAPPAYTPLLSPSKPASPMGGVSWAQSLVNGRLKMKATVLPGRVLPSIDDLKVMEGRRLNAAFVYSDLHGFTKLVATQLESKSFIFLNTFVEVATKLTKLYEGEVMDVAGDRVLSVFYRPSGDSSNEPVEDATTFALQFQTIFTKVISSAFAGEGLGRLSLGVGIDYGEAVVGCVGIRNNKRIVFFGDAANNAAKLQDWAGPGETLLSANANARRPAYLNDQSWSSRTEKLANGTIIFRYNQIFANGEIPPKAR